MGGYSSTILREHFVLFRDGDTAVGAVPPNQHFDHVGHAAMVLAGGNSNALLDPWVNAQIQRGGLGFWHVAECV